MFGINERMHQEERYFPSDSTQNATQRNSTFSEMRHIQASKQRGLIIHPPNYSTGTPALTSPPPIYLACCFLLLHDPKVLRIHIPKNRTSTVDATTSLA
jgi:hypothetical protein